MKEKEFEDIPKKKSIGFKASIKSNDLDEEESLALVTHKFKKFLKEERFQKKDKKNKRKV